MSRPSINQLLSELSSEALSYFFPGYVREREAEPSEPVASEGLADNEPESSAGYEPGILFRVAEADAEDNGICYRMAEAKPEDWSVRFRARRKPAACSVESMASPEEPRITNLPLDEKTQQLLAEIKALQDKYGVTIEQLEAVLTYRVKLSRLRVTARKEVILEDFDRREVRMDTLTKAVFLLYLKHPEGICYKDLVDHRAELEQIYMSITGRGELDAIRKSIDDLVSPLLSNSINEKVSKVKKAFRDVVDERVARFYYIDGDKGTAKSIALDRSNVIWE